MKKSSATDACFAAYRAGSVDTPSHYEVVAFGDSPDLADELGQLILHGPKRATAGLRRDFTDDDLPHVGGHVVVVDGRGEPLCIFQTTEVRVGPLSSVDDAFAWDEDEGDRSRDWWLQAHTEFFMRQAASEGFEFSPDIETVFERFKVVWPKSSQP